MRGARPAAGASPRPSPELPPRGTAPVTSAGGASTAATLLASVLDRLEGAGWARQEAAHSLAAPPWRDAPLAWLAELPAAELGAELRRHSRCEICGHPRHGTVGPVTVAVAGASRLLGDLPHTAACSCGYAPPLVPLVWLRAAERYCAAHPQAAQASCADLREV